ncbi:DUF3326 domain-containing protein [Anthocerotibacter panamensis]|uniref:DUF3326 domain-containing protein n=1 Tax=Anthocerotibacter panamensis TaxID=2857077 RepID=UPI001C40496C|nr:DUF3326 domain-containing protein [Anthocerotibacter panamensis]
MPPLTTLLLIPTGIGASIGGFAGDGLPVARLLAQVSDVLITHPNVLNGAMLYWPMANTLYVEGYALDQFCRGTWALRPVHSNRVGVLLDQGLTPEQRIHHQNVLQGAQATLGLTLGPVLTTDEPVALNLSQARSGSSWGAISNPGTLLRAGEQVKHLGAQALALVVRFPEAGENGYSAGQGVDPIAGLEALLSHLLVRHLGIPCAHAPALDTPEPAIAHLRTSAESLGFTFLPCVLVGLSRAARYVVCHAAGDITVDQVDAVVLPASAFGGAGVLALAQREKPPIFIGVLENETRMQVTAASLGIQSYTVQNYWEVAGILACLKAGVEPASVRS